VGCTKCAVSTGRWRRAVAFAIALYAIFLVVAPFEHHDLACHLKTPQHCTSCASSQLGSDPHALSVPDTSKLADAGRAVLDEVTAEGTILAVHSSGRSPPSFV
jgi:hypothetical protein